MSARDRITPTGDTECTSYPWWAIVDPQLGILAKYDCVGRVASMVTGPFFSREAAEETLKNKRHRFGKHARVFCFSGHMSPGYRERVDASKAEP